MSELGHRSGRIAVGFLDGWGMGPFAIGFEDSERFGPQLLDEEGEPTNRAIQPSSPFWPPYQLWASQGRKTKPGGTTCTFRAPIPTIVQKIGPIFVTLQKGEPNGQGATRYIQLQVPKKPGDK